MNNGILVQPTGLSIDNGTGKTLLGLPQPIPTPYHFPKNYDWILGNNNGSSSEDFVILVDTTKGTNTSINMQLVCQNGGSLSIDWGDGTQGIFIPAGLGNIRRPGSYETRLEFLGTFNTTFTPAHTYAKHGIYQITIKGLFQSAASTVQTPIISTNLISVLSYGNNRLTQINHTNSINLTYIPPFLPTGINSLANAFNGCSNFNDQNIQNWNTSGVTSMASMFTNARSFNQNLANWNINKVTLMNSMFQGASSFTGGGLDNWSMTGGIVTNMTQMFNGTTMPGIILSGWRGANSCTHNNQFQSSNISGSYLPNWTFSSGNNCQSMFSATNLTNVSGFSTWNTSGITLATSMFVNSTLTNTTGLSLWNMSNATGLSAMFQNCTAFNEDLSNWNVNKAQTMQSMFVGATSFKGSGLQNWNLAGLTTSAGLTAFAQNCTFPSAQYDIILNAWAANTGVSQNGVANWRKDLSPHFGNSRYTSAGSASRAALVSYGWTITDGGII